MIAHTIYYVLVSSMLIFVFIYFNRLRALVRTIKRDKPLFIQKLQGELAVLGDSFQQELSLVKTIEPYLNREDSKFSDDVKSQWRTIVLLRKVGLTLFALALLDFAYICI